MGKKNKIVHVPLAVDMDDDTFCKHLEKRHPVECKIEGFMARNNLDVWVPMYRTFHARLHRLAIPGQHDHTHEG